MEEVASTGAHPAEAEAGEIEPNERARAARAPGPTAHQGCGVSALFRSLFRRGARKSPHRHRGSAGPPPTASASPGAGAVVSADAVEVGLATEDEGVTSGTCAGQVLPGDDDMGAGVSSAGGATTPSPNTRRSRFASHVDSIQLSQKSLAKVLSPAQAIESRMSAVEEEDGTCDDVGAYESSQSGAGCGAGAGAGAGFGAAAAAAGSGAGAAPLVRVDAACGASAQAAHAGLDVLQEPQSSHARCDSSSPDSAHSVEAPDAEPHTMCSSMARPNRSFNSDSSDFREMPAPMVLEPHHHSHHPVKSILKPSPPAKRFDAATMRWVDPEPTEAPCPAASEEAKDGATAGVSRRHSARSASSKSVCSAVSFADQHGRTLCKVVVCTNLQYSKRPKRTVFGWFRRQR